MRFLTSVVSSTEASQIADLSDLIDIKNPSKGPLGAPDQVTVQQTRSVIGSSANLSVALGDMDKIGHTTISVAKLLVECGATYVKTALADIDQDTALSNLRILKNSMPNGVRVIAAAYADASALGYFNPVGLPQLALEAGLDGVLLDTCSKDGKTLLDHSSDQFLANFISEARQLGLMTALAGSLSINDMDRIFEIDPDWVGFRSALTLSGIREKAGIDRAKVSAIKSRLNKNNDEKRRA